ncbi:hypothetical protein BGZ81_009960, partial [Podila clonocystis]
GLPLAVPTCWRVSVALEALVHCARSTLAMRAHPPLAALSLHRLRRKAAARTWPRRWRWRSRSARTRWVVTMRRILMRTGMI